MDTILYFMKKRGLQEPEIEPVGLKTYLLVRIRLDVERETWFGRKLGQGLTERTTGGLASVSEGAYSLAGMEDSMPEEKNNLMRWRWMLSHPIRAWRKTVQDKAKKHARQEYEYRAKREEEAHLAMKEQILAETEASMKKLTVQVQDIVGDMAECYSVYEDSLRKALIGGKTELLPALWKKHFPIAEFSAYNQGFWVEQLLARAIQPHFLILGTAPCLYDVIEAHAHRMKSLRWILPKEACNEELSGFVEDFYTEYGLAIILQPMENMAILKRLGIGCKEPVNILDFTGETYMAVPQVPAGSVWLDMFSVEEKRRAALAKGKGILYFSLKEKWKSAQKRCNCPVLP